jgi:hypothetical protein
MSPHPVVWRRPASVIKIHHTFDLDSRKAFVEKSFGQR